MKMSLCVLIALATLLVTSAPLLAASYKTGPSGSNSSKGSKSSITRINPASGSSKSSSGARKKSSGTGKTSSRSHVSSSRNRDPDWIRPPSDQVYVEGHMTKKGTYVPSHLRSKPDRNNPKRKPKY
ncbi:MAG TPA: hypothetical protein VL175_19330 [Pirellulales bacterium]|jgi:hypothetical protein|nr:hypothetical protein [Pirellulales bacterium]